nr:protein altered xyloglucan 4-like [Quercus suber]
MNMQSSSTVSKEKNQFGKVERCINVGRPAHFMLSSLFIATIFGIFLLYSPNPLILMTKKGLDPVLKQHEASSPTQGHDSVQKQLDQDKPHKKKEHCDLSKGHWIREPRGSYFYTNSSCATIPNSKNCFKQGRMDKDFLNWRWKPDQCELPRFDAKFFLQIVQGKIMAFIGDSVARNHIESLLCLLSQVSLQI